MNRKQLLGFLTILLGLAFIIFIDHENDRLDQAKETIAETKREIHDSESGFFSFNPIGAKITADMTAGPKQKIQRAERRIARYDIGIILLQLGGIIVVLTGVIIMHVFHRNPQKKKHRKRFRRI